MTRKLLTLTAILAFHLLIVGCKNTQDKVNDFVADYNNAAASMTNNVVTHTSAAAMPNDEIRILFKTNMPQDESNKTLYSQLLPSLATQIVNSDRKILDLTDEGVKLNFVMLADDGSELAGIVVDKKKLAEMKQSETAAMKAMGEKAGQSKRLSPQLQEVLKMLNKSLPIVDKEAGTKITQIDINGNMELVYNVEVTGSLAEMLKDPGMRDVMKEEMLRDPTVRKMLPGLRTYGVSTIKYVYLDAKGKTLNETVITTNDLQ